MTTAGSFDAPIEIFGGLVTDMSPADLPHGVSPDCQYVIFSNGGVATRPGMQALFGSLSGNPTVNYVKTYETLNATLRTMALDSNGVLYKETTPGTLSSIATGLVNNAFANSTTLFGREYLAISDGKTGNDLPRQYDDTNFDRVSQSGPGAGPSVVDENVSVAVTASPNGATQPAAVAIAASPTGATENGLLVTITTTAARGRLTASGGGTAAAAGSVSPGAHQVCVIFKTRQGYLTKPGPATTWTSSGGKRAVVTNIPVGPSNVVGRILCFTGAGGTSFFYTANGSTLFSGNMAIADNTTTSLVVDFSDAILLAGTNVDNLFKLIELGDCAGA